MCASGTFLLLCMRKKEVVQLMLSNIFLRLSVELSVVQKIDKKLELSPLGCMPLPINQVAFTFISVQTHITVYVVKTLKEFNKKYYTYFLSKFNVSLY